MLKESDVTITVTCEPEDMPVRGNVMSSGDEAFDKECEDKVIADLEGGNEWAWCVAHVKAIWTAPSGRRYEGDVYLGGCSYDSEEDFVGPSGGDYFADLKAEAIDSLNAKIEAMREDLAAAALHVGASDVSE